MPSRAAPTDRPAPGALAAPAAASPATAPTSPPPSRAGASSGAPVGGAGAVAHLSSPVARLASRALAASRASLTAYAQVLFSGSPWAGLLFLLGTFVAVPAHGLAGLVGLASAQLWAWALRRPAAHLADGFYGFNGLLVGLALGLYFRPSPTFYLLLLVASLLAVVVGAALRNAAERLFGLPVLSLPFVLVSWVALLAARRFAAVEVALDPILTQHLGESLVQPWAPDWAALYLRSLGAVFFQLSTASGALVLAGLLLASRWAALLSLLGFAAGASVYLSLGGRPSDLDAHFVAFNFLLPAIAVGGVFVLLRPASLALAEGAGALAAVLAAALLAFLDPYDLPVLALPFIATTLLILSALQTGVPGGPLSPGGLELVRSVPASPEENLRRVVYRARRYPDPSVPAFFLPVLGQWTITQGPNGPHTHQGPWAHAWDFEVLDEAGSPHRPAADAAPRPVALEDYYAYGAPVVAPADGKVVRVVDHLPDTPLGEVDVANNWGNVVVLWHPGEIYTVLAHLQKGSALVKPGQPVVRGQALARVGSSGRSPVPHLHFQAQRSPELGAPTTPAELLHYVQGSAHAHATIPDSPRYVTHGAPREGDRVSPLPLAARVRATWGLEPGRTLRWRVRDDARPSPPGAVVPPATRVERWESLIDPLGARRVVAHGEPGPGASGRAAARALGEAPFYTDDQYATFLDYTGRADTVLAAYSLALARLPWVEDAGLRWGDTPAVTAWMSWPRRLAHDLLLPFHATGAVETTSRVAAAGGGALVVTTELRGALPTMPDRLEVTLAPHGPTQLRAFRGTHPLWTAEVIA